MGVKRCAYGECRSDSRFVDREYMKGVYFVRFPKPKTDSEKCDRWIRACSRADNFGRHTITGDTYVCSLHFVGGKGPTEKHPDPVPATARGVELELFKRKKIRPAPKDRVPLVMSTPKRPRMEQPSPVTYRCNENQPQSDQYIDPLPINVDQSRTPTSTIVSIIEPKEESDTKNILMQPKAMMQDNSTQTVLEMDHLSPYSDGTLINPKLLKRDLFLKDVLKDSKSCKFYTGLVSVQLLMFLFQRIKEKGDRLTIWKGRDTSDNPDRVDQQGRILSTFEAFLLMLVRVRRGMDVEHLADSYGISPATVSRYCYTWIEFLSRELSFLIKWPSREQLQATMPRTFRHFKKTAGIIDCTEFFVQKPSVPSSQRITWSSYKHHNTFKLLVCISPTGAITYLSDLWSGSVSDRRIVQESGFLDYVNRGDDIMADRGFLIRDLLALRGATLNIPPFAHGKQLSSAAVTRTRRIASARIHVERAIGRLKTFKILNGIFPLKSKKQMNQTVKLCAQLCNLDTVLVR